MTRRVRNAKNNKRCEMYKKIGGCAIHGASRPGPGDSRPPGRAGPFVPPPPSGWSERLVGPPPPVVGFPGLLTPTPSGCGWSIHGRLRVFFFGLGRLTEIHHMVA